MDRKGAKTLTMEQTECRRLHYADLVAKIGDNDHLEVSGPSGIRMKVDWTPTAPAMFK